MRYCRNRRQEHSRDLVKFNCFHITVQLTEQEHLLEVASRVQHLAPEMTQPSLFRAFHDAANTLPLVKQNQRAAYNFYDKHAPNPYPAKKLMFGPMRHIPSFLICLKTVQDQITVMRSVRVETNGPGM